MFTLFNGFDVTGAFLSLFSGGLMLGALFMATDYVTSPLTTKGRVIFALGCGFLTSAIRVFCQLRRGRFLRRAADEPAGAYINEGCRTKPVGGVKA